MLSRAVMLVALATACGARSGFEDDVDASAARPMGRCREARRRADFNGDGLGDLAVGTSSGARVYLGARDPGALALASVITLGASSVSSQVSYAGDVNGDGRGDLVVYRQANIPVEPQGPPRRGLAEVHLGTPTGVDPSAQAVLQGPADAPETFPTNVFAAGDVNGDGYDDLVTGSLRSDGVTVFLGSARGIDPTPSARVQRGMPSGADASWFARGLGDFNGDGFDDVAVAGEVEARIFWGGAGGLSMQRSALVAADARGRVGPYLDAVGDLDGDGCPDAMLLSASDAGVEMRVLAGGSEQIAPLAWAPRLPSGELARFNGASDFEQAGDVDGDGYDDVLLTGTCLSPTAPCPDRPPREQHLVRGHAAAAAPPPTVSALAAGVRVAPIGDLTGDGRSEVAVATRGGGSLQIYAWGAGGPSATRSVTLALPTGVTLSGSVAGTAR